MTILQHIGLFWVITLILWPTIGVLWELDTESQSMGALIFSASLALGLTLLF